MNPTPQSWLSNNIKSILSVIVVSLSFGYFYMCSIRGIKPDSQILIAIVGANGIVLGYWFGSSSSSSKKDDAMVSNLGNPTVTGDKPIVNVTQTPLAPAPESPAV